MSLQIDDTDRQHATSHLQRIESPVTGEFVADVRDASPDEVSDAVQAAAARLTSAVRRAELARARVERCERLEVVAELLEERSQELAGDLVFEHGKPLTEARAEIEEVAAGLRLTTSFARNFASHVPPLADPRKRIFFSDEPIGAIGVITPWNFPLYIPIEYMGPALAMGNSVVWKPAESTPRSNRHLLQAFRDAGFDEDELVFLEGGPRTGQALVRHAALAALCFTGSTEVGREIADSSPGRPLLLELGGNGPTVVFDDAHIPDVAKSIASSSFWASGQSCAATERILAHEGCAEALAEAVAEASTEYALADPREESTTLGPLHLAETAEKMTRHVADALERGATLVCGGEADRRFPTPRYWPPTVLTGVDPEADAFLEETFGPIAPITPFTAAEDAVRLAAQGGWGLVAAVFTSDLSRAHRMADALPAGMVVINDNSNYWEPQIAVGGAPATRSGIGRLGLENALRFTSCTKVVAMDVSKEHAR
jgi:succinate-semialdehyde dehydrogenase/glutarate-semialdehyde dehydrogenase